jgi:hypothetical protein
LPSVSRATVRQLVQLVNGRIVVGIRLLHDLRDTHATHLLTAGVGIETTLGGIRSLP